MLTIKGLSNFINFKHLTKSMHNVLRLLIKGKESGVELKITYDMHGDGNSNSRLAKSSIGHLYS